MLEKSGHWASRSGLSIFGQPRSPIALIQSQPKTEANRGISVKGNGWP
jgi:hypothetical protein